jgi:hypothetical protein
MGQTPDVAIGGSVHDSPAAGGGSLEAPALTQVKIYEMRRVTLNLRRRSGD